MVAGSSPAGRARLLRVGEAFPDSLIAFICEAPFYAQVMVRPSPAPVWEIKCTVSVVAYYSLLNILLNIL
jgi:hypothetical protein